MDFEDAADKMNNAMILINENYPVKFTGTCSCSPGDDCSCTIDGCSNIKYYWKDGVKHGICVDSDIDKFLEHPDETPEETWSKNFKDIYDADALDSAFVVGIEEVENITLMSNKGLLDFVASGNSPDNATAMATAIANYWAAQITPGTVPFTEGATAVGVVTNDAQKIIPSIVSALLGLADKSSGDSGFKEDYVEVFEAIENEVKTIQWTVMEIMPSPAPPVPVIVSIS